MKFIRAKQQQKERHSSIIQWKGGSRNERPERCTRHIIPNSRVQLKPALGCKEFYSSSFAVADRFAYKLIKSLLETNDWLLTGFVSRQYRHQQLLGHACKWHITYSIIILMFVTSSKHCSVCQNSSPKWFDPRFYLCSWTQIDNWSRCFFLRLVKSVEYVNNPKAFLNLTLVLLEVK